MIAGRLLATRARRYGALAIAVLLIAAVVTSLAVAGSGPDSEPIRAHNEQITVPGGPGVDGDVTLDAGLYLPASTPAPAVIVAHGFGGSRLSVDAEAQRLAKAGFVVLTYSARGFGTSTGRIGLDSINYEVPDASALVDWLADRPEVVQDGPDDPRVGVTGGSYGGALSLMLAGTDSRIDSVAAVATWNNLQQALFPNNRVRTSGEESATTPAAIGRTDDGVFKQSWAAALMTSVLTGSALAGADEDSGAAAEDGAPAEDDTSADKGQGAPSACGRLMTGVCAAYTRAAETGQLTPAMSELLGLSSPSQVASNIAAPTLLVQGENDSLFGLDQADANARAIAANGTPVAVSWYSGGHNGGGLDDATQDRVTSWFDYYLARKGPVPAKDFRYELIESVSQRGNVRHRTLHVPEYPGLAEGATSTQEVALTGPGQVITNPPGGQPAAITSLPFGPAAGGSALAALTALTALPGQTASFVSAPIDNGLVTTGSATITLSVSRVSPARAGGDDEPAVLYASLASVPGETDSLADSPGGLAGFALGDLAAAPAAGAVAPVRIDDLPSDGSAIDVTVALPAVSFQVPAGQRLLVRVATTDQGYAGPRTSAAYEVSLADNHAATVPAINGVRLSHGSDQPIGWAIGLAILVVGAALALAIAGRIRRRPQGLGAGNAAPSPSTAVEIIAVDGLRKEYPGGIVAVDDASFRVKRGQVLGLLGPNGAGKTTTLRMMLGLIKPSAGTVTLFGEHIRPSASVLSRIGSFVEGPGFLPHLSGQANIELYWRATGRPAADAHIEEVLAIADLGSAIRRRVKNYSQGMRQRLAIAQAMLGLPDLLILDEPTNGLDPPQIHAMREVLRRYAAAGRTVLVSSHLLSEVEQTCSDVVVMSRGRTIAAGSVADMVASSGEIGVTTPDPAAAASCLRTVEGIGDIEETASGVLVDLRELPLSSALQQLLDAGIAITAAAPRNRLEDVFLDLVGAGTANSSADGDAKGSADGSVGGTPFANQPASSTPAAASSEGDLHS